MTNELSTIIVDAGTLTAIVWAITNFLGGYVSKLNIPKELFAVAVGLITAPFLNLIGFLDYGMTWQGFGKAIFIGIVAVMVSGNANDRIISPIKDKITNNK